MTGFDFTAFAAYAIIAIAFGFLYWWVTTLKDRQLRDLCRVDKSCVVDVAGTGSMLIPRLNPLIGESTTIYLPAGDGLYHTRRKESRNENYLNGLRDWLDRGATIHIIVTRPSDESIAFWKKALAEFPPGLKVHILHREQAAEDRREQIAKLDTFHTTLILNPPGSPASPGALWIEANHPIGSKYAYNVEYVAPADAADDARLEKYRIFYEDLLQPGPKDLLKPDQSYVESFLKPVEKKLAA